MSSKESRGAYNALGTRERLQTGGAGSPRAPACLPAPDNGFVTSGRAGLAARDGGRRRGSRAVRERSAGLGPLHAAGPGTPGSWAASSFRTHPPICVTTAGQHCCLLSPHNSRWSRPLSEQRPVAHMVGRIMPPQRCPRPTPQNLCICHLTWRGDFAGAIKDFEMGPLLDYPLGPSWVFERGRWGVQRQ